MSLANVCTHAIQGLALKRLNWNPLIRPLTVCSRHKWSLVRSRRSLYLKRRSSSLGWLPLQLWNTLFNTRVVGQWCIVSAVDMEVIQTTESEDFTSVQIWLLHVNTSDFRAYLQAVFRLYLCCYCWDVDGSSSPTGQRNIQLKAGSENED